MSKKLVYTGTGRGQGNRVRIAGFVFIRGAEPVEVPNKLADHLNKREGFEILKPSKKTGGK